MKRALLVLAGAVVLSQVVAPVYRFPEGAPFRGAHFLNPYAGGSGTWHRASLHAHGVAWGGVTDGRQSNEEVLRRYRARGYTVTAISNYQQIASVDGLSSIPAYEHGYNVRVCHQLAIGARRVEWLDFLLSPFTSQKQFIIDRVGEGADLVALCHPRRRDGYSLDDMRNLTGYQLLEVVNGPFTATDAWDAALSTGHAVWALANDDSHDLDDPRRAYVAWTMIQSPGTSPRDLVEALRAGRTYGVARTGGGADTVLASVACLDGRITVTCDGAPATFEFTGQDGEVRHRLSSVTTASYTFQPADTYIRAVVRSPRTTLYLNPILRYDGAHVPAPRATVDVERTLLLRGGLLSGALLLAAALVRRRRRCHAPGQPALATPERP